MALCVRRLVLAATLAAVVALLPCTSSAPVARATETGDFTAAQRTNTLAVLQAFGRAIPELGRKWTGDDFCSWEYTECDRTGVFVSVIGAPYAGTLPEMPVDVDYKHVIIRGLDFQQIKRLVGTLPASWSRLELLTLVSFPGCGVSGTLPASWRSMKSLALLWLEDGDSITGTVPPEWASMRRLEMLLLRRLPLRSTLPTQWSSMASLKVLSLEGTQVYGSLPPEWSGMSKAQSLQLENCDLSGSLPPEWAAMPRLRLVTLRGNHFCGCVPDSWAQKAALVVDIEDKHKGSNCIAGADCTTTTTTTTRLPTTTTAEPPTTTTTTTTQPPTAPPTTTTETPSEPTTTASPTATPTSAPETECEVDGCEVCEGDSAARCARCREGYFLTSEKTCRANGDGGVAAVSSGAAAAAAVCMAVLLSVGLAA